MEEKLVRRDAARRLGPLFGTFAGVFSLGLLFVYGWWWSQTITASYIHSSDFAAIFAGGKLWAAGHHSDLYDLTLQAHLHAQLIYPDQGGFLGFVYPPIGAVIAAPFTLFSLSTAYRIWGIFQMILMGLGVGIAFWASPKSNKLSPQNTIAILGVALVGPGILALLLLGQWDGIGALGLAVAYACWRKDRLAWGGAILAGSSLVAKPHLAVGMAFFLLGWQNRRVIKGAILGTATVILLSLASVGLDGLRGFVGALLADGPPHGVLANLLGVNGFLGSWISNQGLAQSLGLVGSGLLILLCWGLGRGMNKGRISLNYALACALALSLAASPHLLMHDLALLAIPCTWLLASLDWSKPKTPFWSGGLFVLYLIFMQDWGNAAMGPPGRLTPLVLVILGTSPWWFSRPFKSKGVGIRRQQLGDPLGST